MLHLFRDIDMLDFMRLHKVEFNGEVNYFNEIMSEGDLTEDIFGAEFCSCRSVYHQLPQEDYEEQAIAPISDFLSLMYDEAHLYFSSEYDDVMNLIVVLAYLDRNTYEGDVILHIIDKDYNVLKDVSIAITGFYAIYCDVFIFGRMPNAKLPKELSSNITKYMQNRQNEMV